VSTETSINNLTSMVGKCGKQLERIANALERLSPPPSAEPSKPTPPASPRALPPEGPTLAERLGEPDVDISKAGF